MFRWLFENTPSWAYWVGFVLGPPLLIAGLMLRRRPSGKPMIALGSLALLLTALSWVVVMVGLLCTGRNGDWIC